jgi:hypothetical protein
VENSKFEVVRTSLISRNNRVAITAGSSAIDNSLYEIEGGRFQPQLRTRRLKGPSQSTSQKTEKTMTPIA